MYGKKVKHENQLNSPNGEENTEKDVNPAADARKDLGNVLSRDDMLDESLVMHLKPVRLEKL